jgi:hypothetical protein
MAVGDYPLEDFATYLDGVLPDGVQIYGFAADIGKLPAVVLAPGDPAIVVNSQSPALGSLAWGVDAMIVVSRSQPKYAIRAITDLWQQLKVAGDAYAENVQVLSLEQIGDLEWAGEAALAGSVPMIIHTQGS